MGAALAAWDAPVLRPTRTPALQLESGGDVPWDDAVDLYLARCGLAESTQTHVRLNLTAGRVRLFRQAFGLASVLGCAAWQLVREAEEEAG